MWHKCVCRWHTLHSFIQRHLDVLECMFLLCMCVFWQLGLADCPWSSNRNLNALSWYQHTPGHFNCSHIQAARTNSVLGTAWITYWRAYFYTQSHIHLCTVCPLPLKSLSVEQANKIPSDWWSSVLYFVCSKQKERPVFPSSWLWNLLVTASVIGCLSLDTLAPVSAVGTRTVASSFYCKISIFKKHTGENTHAKKSVCKLGEAECKIICLNCSWAAENNIRFH